MSLEATSSQTVGPYLHIGLEWLTLTEVAPPGVAGERVSIEGRIVDGDGAPVPDAIVEIWQADAEGRYPQDGDAPGEQVFRGFGRCPTDASGTFRFATIKPGPVSARGGGMQAPHLNVTVFMRGLLRHLSTRMYFPDEPSNAQDPVLALVPRERRPTLVARREGERLRWDIVLQGGGETVFFDC